MSGWVGVLAEVHPPQIYFYVPRPAQKYTCNMRRSLTEVSLYIPMPRWLLTLLVKF